MDVRLLCKYSATLGFIGYLPAPGTVASLCTIIVIYFMQSYIFNVWVFMLLLTVGYSIINQASHYFHDKDPSAIVFDECIGTLITFFYLPIALSIHALFIGFLLFRFFDITKLGFASWERTWQSPLGILMDDVIAGLFSNITVQLGYLLYSSIIK